MGEETGTPTFHPLIFRTFLHVQSSGSVRITFLREPLVNLGLHQSGGSVKRTWMLRSSARRTSLCWASCTRRGVFVASESRGKSCGCLVERVFVMSGGGHISSRSWFYEPQGCVLQLGPWLPIQFSSGFRLLSYKSPHYPIPSGSFFCSSHPGSLMLPPAGIWAFHSARTMRACWKPTAAMWLRAIRQIVAPASTCYR